MSVAACLNIINAVNNYYLYTFSYFTRVEFHESNGYISKGSTYFSRRSTNMASSTQAVFDPSWLRIDASNNWFRK